MRILLIFLILFPWRAWAVDPLVPDPTPFQVHLFPYVLKRDGEPMYPGQKIGQLVFRDAIELKSESYRFGGFSALSIVDKKIYALSDGGRLLRATPAFKANDIVSIDEASFDTLWPEGEHAPAKAEYDSEGLTHLKNDHFAVAFEQQHRIGLYQLGETITLEKTLLAPKALSLMTKENKGIEGLVMFASNRLLAITEGVKNGEGNTMGYIVDIKKGEWQPLALKPTGAFRPTELAVLSKKHLLLLERSYSPVNGLEARISTINRADIRHC